MFSAVSPASSVQQSTQSTQSSPIILWWQLVLCSTPQDLEIQSHSQQTFDKHLGTLLGTVTCILTHQISRGKVKQFQQTLACRSQSLPGLLCTLIGGWGELATPTGPAFSQTHAGLSPGCASIEDHQMAADAKSRGSARPGRPLTVGRGHCCSARCRAEVAQVYQLGEGGGVSREWVQTAAGEQGPGGTLILPHSYGAF